MIPPFFVSLSCIQRARLVFESFNFENQINLWISIILYQAISMIINSIARMKYPYPYFRDVEIMKKEIKGNVLQVNKIQVLSNDF